MTACGSWPTQLARRRVRVLDASVGVDSEDDVARALDEVPEARLPAPLPKRKQKGRRKRDGEQDQGCEARCHSCFSLLLSRIQGKGQRTRGQGKATSGNPRTRPARSPVDTGGVRGLVRSRPSDGSAAPGARQGLQRDRRGHAGAVPRRQHRALHGGAPRAAAAAARARARADPADEQPVPRRRRERQLELGRPRLLRPPPRDERLRRAGALQHLERQPRRGRPARPGAGHERHAVVSARDADGRRRSGGPSRTRKASRATRRRRS